MEQLVERREAQRGVTKEPVAISVNPNELSGLYQDSMRYAFIRLLNPRQFTWFWRTALTTGRHLDDLIDEAVEGFNNTGVIPEEPTGPKGSIVESA